jgi:serine/threonine-protein kinase
MPGDTTPTNETVVREPKGARAGTVINDRFKLVRCVASGGYGDVWSGDDLQESRRVAVKILRNDAGNNDPSALARMRQEAEILTSMDHPNIVRVFSFENSDYGYFLVMEFLEGLAIDQVLQREGPGKPEIVVPVVGQLLSALHLAHSKQILHRDIKPENIILEPRKDGYYQPKLLDFGIAKAMKLLSDSDSGVTLVQTRSGGFIGTPKYSPPEQAVGDPIGPNVDLYSLGLVLSEWLTGTPRITAERHGDVMGQLLNGEPHDVSDCPYAWQAWLRKMIAKSPSGRYATAMEAMEQFESLVIEGSKTPDFLDDSPFVNAGSNFDFGSGAFSDHAGPLELDFDRVQRSAPAAPEPVPATFGEQPVPGTPPPLKESDTGPQQAVDASKPFARPRPNPMQRKELPPLNPKDSGNDAETLVMVGWLVVVFILSCGVVFFMMMFLGSS